MSTPTIDTERGMHGCTSSSRLLTTRMHRNSSCITEASFLQNEFLAKDLYKSNIKLRIYFSVLLVLNILLIVAFGLLYFTYARNWDQKDTPTSESPPLEDLQNLVTGRKTDNLLETKISKEFFNDINCATLKYKLYATDLNSRTGRCSFEDFIDALVKFLKPTDNRDVIHLSGGVPADKRNEHLEYTISNWIPDKKLQSAVEYHVTNSSIKITSDGYYFLYCRLTFSNDVNGKRSRGTAIKHSIRIKPVNQSFQKFVTVSTTPTFTDRNSHSYIQRVAKLRKGEELKITTSRAGKVQYDTSDGSENYFGMFKL